MWDFTRRNRSLKSITRLAKSLFSLDGQYRITRPSRDSAFQKMRKAYELIEELNQLTEDNSSFRPIINHSERCFPAIIFFLL